MLELIKRGPDGIDGIISLYEIPEEWAQDAELFKAWWEPKTELGRDNLYHIVEPARLSDEAKAGRLLREPVHNLIMNAGITRYLTNNGATTQGGTQPLTQILSVGNGATSGITRTDSSVAGDGFGTNARRAPASSNTVGFQVTIVTNYLSGDAAGTWTNIGWYGGGSATTGTGTGVLYTHALFPYVKGASAVAVNYVFLMSN